MNQPTDLVLVTGHATFKAGVRDVAATVEQGRDWVLLPFQGGEVPFYLEHIRKGVELAAANASALLVFSGGRTRPESGEWSEAGTYRRIAEARDWWIGDEDPALRASVARRAATEDFARDSFENLLFGLCRFQQVTGAYPRTVTLITWAFKRARYDLHRSAIRFPSDRFVFLGLNDPVDMESALEGNRRAHQLYLDDPYGTTGELADKRRQRNPFHQRHSYDRCPWMEPFFSFMEEGRGSRGAFAGDCPWEPGEKSREAAHR